jgi:hypothetical protein
VAQLDPPSGALLCGPNAWANGSGGGYIGQRRDVTLTCARSTISSIDFASFGHPTGTCGSYSIGACHLPSSLRVVQALCLNASSCTIPMSAFGPAPCERPRLAVQARCADGQQHTYWDFTDMDSQFLSFWEAFRGNDSDVIVGFCTAPSWMYDNSSYDYVDDASTWWCVTRASHSENL